MHLANVRGKLFHAELGKKYKGMGRHLEQEQVVFLTNDTTMTAPILGVISATPDMYWYKNTTLYIEEWKTITPNAGAKQKGRCKTEGYNQGLLYGYVTNLNLHNKKSHIRIKIPVGVHEGPVAETVNKKPTAVFEESLTGAEVSTKAEAFLEKVLGKKWCIVPFDRAVLAVDPRGHGRTNKFSDDFCADCRRLFRKTKRSTE